ncbi:hypothetical protein DYB30_003278 [Aphanomyces astaci]|uniref:SET domain-containing protein n=1 Tax=Aphanomyces astaci TaxID=112090 RepID=A0A397DFA4_APHAT|nr:hypothetical protein DYB30_003278 [Aphanomyces astaci]
MPQAEQSVAQAVRLAPTSRHSLELLVYILLRKGHSNKAMQILKEARVRADETTLQAGKAMTLGSSSSHGMSMEAVASARGFELLTRCVYVPPLMQPSVTEAEPCFCSSTDSSEVACHDTECINYATYVECPLDRCPTGRGCRNQRLQRPDLFPHLEPFQTEFKGYGVRTTERVRALDPVGEYVGEIIGQKELLRRTNGLGRMETNFYYIQMSNGVYIDARHRGGFTRFVNHSCNPNCKAEKWTVGGETRLLVFALRELAPGDEITFDYQWTLLGRQRIKCFCGESVCKGFIGGDVEKNPTDTPDGVFQDPTDADTVDEYLVGRTLRLFNPSSGDGSHSFSIVLVKSYDPNTREHTVVDAPPSMDQTSTSPPSTQRRRRRPTNRFDKDDSSSDGCSSNSSSDDDTISHRSGGRDAVDGTTMRQVSLSTLQWQLYIDLRGLSADDVQKAVFSIPKLNRPPRRPHLANATPLSAPASPLYLTPPRPSTPLSSSAAPRPPTFKLLLKGLSPEVNATMLRRLLGSHANTVVAIDLFFLDTSNFGHIGWALLELSDPIVFEKMRSRFDNKPFVGNTVVRSFRATDQGISSFYRVKETTIRRKHLVSTTDPKGTSSRPSSATGTRPPPPPPPSLPNSSRQPPRRPGDGSSPTTNDHTSNSPMSIASEMYCFGRKLNWVVDSSSLRPLVSPSRKAGMSASVEAMLQSKCTKIMLNVVKMLKFNREDASTAIVLFHRYVSVHPMNVSTVEWMAATCLHVVLKSHSRSLDWPAFVTAVYAAKYHGGGSSSAAQPSADELERVEHHVLSMEAALLDGLRYDISSTDPFAMLDACFRGGNLDDDNRAHKFGKRLVSDSLTATSLWTHFPVECLVVAVLYIASAAAVSANPDMPPPPPYLPRLPRSHRHTFDAAVAPLLTLFEATRCTDLPRSVLEERIRHFVDTQDAKDMPAIYFEPSNWPSAYLAWQSSHQAVQLTATHMENVAAIRRRAFVARIKAVGVPWPDLAGRPVYLQPWPYKQPHHATRGMPEACLRELSTLVNVHARDTALFVTLIGIVFPTQPQRVDDLLVLPSPSKPNNNAIDMFTDLFPGETAARTMPPISTAKRPVVKASTKSKLLQV